MSEGRVFSPLKGLFQRIFGEGTLARRLNSRVVIEAARTLMKSEPELADLVAEIEGVGRLVNTVV